MVTAKTKDSATPDFQLQKLDDLLGEVCAAIFFHKSLGGSTGARLRLNRSWSCRGIIPYASRLLRSHALVLREAQYLEAANAVGASNMRIIFRHLIPNSMAPWIVLLAVNVGNAIVLEASLSFLGIGIAPPTPSWGNLLTRATTFFANNQHLVLAPGIIITVVVVCANLVGDSLRDILDPRLRGSR